MASTGTLARTIGDTTRATGLAALVRLHVMPWRSMSWRYLLMVGVLVFNHYVALVQRDSSGHPLGHSWFRSAAVGAIFVFARSMLSVRQLFPYTLAQGRTRAAFFVATCLFTVLEALGWGIALAIAAAVDTATGVPWLGMPFSGPVTQVLGYAVLFLVPATAGTLVGAIAQREGLLAAGFFGFFLIVGWMLWQSQIELLAAGGRLTLLMTVSALTTGLLVAVSYLLLRRADA